MDGWIDTRWYGSLQSISFDCMHVYSNEKQFPMRFVMISMGKIQEKFLSNFLFSINNMWRQIDSYLLNWLNHWKEFSCLFTWHFSFQSLERTERRREYGRNDETKARETDKTISAQCGKKCPSIESVILEYKKRRFLSDW